MKPGTLTNKRLLLPLLGIALVALLASWDFKQTGGDYKQNQQEPTDTVPKKKKNDRKVRDLDDVLNELDAVNIDQEMLKAKEEMAKALKDIDYQKIQLDVQKAMQEVDMVKIKEDIAKAMKDIDFEKIKKDVQESVAKIDFDKMKLELKEMEKIDFSNMKAEFEKMQEELQKLGPKLQEDMKKMEIDLSNAKVEIEKAKVELRELKEFVDQLDRDGLINKKDTYSIEHKDGELIINGKKASDKTYNQHRSFLEKHKKFSMKKTADDFDIDRD